MWRHKKYTGDCPAKKVTRLATWQSIARLLGRRRFHAGSYLTLPSRHAGDVGVLLGMGIPIENIVGVDREPLEATLARLKYPSLEVYDGDVATFAQRSQRQFTCAHLDFCAAVTPKSIKWVTDVAQSVAPGGVIGCNFQIGREAMYARRCEELKTQARAQLDPALMEQSKDYEQAVNRFSRALLVEEEVRKRTLSLNLEARLFYKSSIHPWVTLLFSKGMQRRKEPENHYYTTDEYDLGRFALALEKKGEDPKLLLNLSKTSMAAYRAHQTRGTY